MDESSEVIRILSEAGMYRPLKNPSPTEQVEFRWKRYCRWVFGIAWPLAFATAVALGPLRGMPMVWASWTPLAAWGLLLCPAAVYTLIDPVIHRIRRAHRATDEAHHQLARWALREPQVAALAAHGVAVLEDMEDQYRARLATGLGRLSVLVGDKAAIVTTALGILGLYKVATDAHWLAPGSPAIGSLLGFGMAMALLPALMRSFSERLDYQCNLLAAARKKKARETGAPMGSGVGTDAQDGTSLCVRAT